MTVSPSDTLQIPPGFTSIQPAPSTSRASTSRQGSVGVYNSQAGPSRVHAGQTKGSDAAATANQQTSAEEQLYAGPTLFGRGWREVESFEDMSDEEDYESDEEETYAILDLGPELDHRSMAKEANFQLIGLETSTPFLKLGNQVYHGKVTDPIGDEVILSRERNENDPSHPSWPPFYKANHHLSFRPIILLPKTAGTASGQTASSQPGDADYLGPQRVDPSTLRPITMQAAAPFGPNRGGRAELTGSMQNKERSATGQYIPTGPGPGMPGRAGTARSSVAPSAVAATPTPIPTQRPLAGRADSQRRDSTPLRAVSVVDMGGAVITPKAEPGEAGVPGPSMLTEAPPSLSVQGSERDTCGLMTAASHGSEPYGGTGFAGQADAGSSDFSTAPPRKKGGRPLGSGKPKQRFVFESEDALRSGITEQDLASNPIVELIVTSGPTADGTQETIKLTKKQVINVLEGRPLRGKGSRAPYASVRTRMGRNPDGVMEEDVLGENAAGLPVREGSRQDSQAPLPPGQVVIPGAGQIMFKHVGKEHADAERERRPRK